MELGGPTVNEPQNDGFGQMIITKIVPVPLQGRASLQFLSEGVRCAASDHAAATPPNRPMNSGASFDHLVGAAEPEWAARRAALHSKRLARAAITSAALLHPDRPATRDLTTFHRAA